MEMYELCMFFKNYEKAKVKLVEFQKSLETVGWNGSAPPSDLKLVDMALVLGAWHGETAGQRVCHVTSSHVCCCREARQACSDL